MTTHSQISLECQPPVAISDPQPDTTPLNHLPGGSSTVTPNSNQTQEGVSSYPRCFVWCRLPQATDSAPSRGPVGGRSPRPEACHVQFLRRRPSDTPTDRVYKKCIMPGLNVDSCSEEPGVRSFSRESHRGIRPTAQSGIQPEYRSEFSLTKSTPGRRAVRARCCQFRQAPPLRRPAGPTRP